MITIKCAKCRKKIFRYIKVGKGQLWHCWKDRIIKDYSIKEGNKVKCQCGNLIGIDEGKWIKLKRNSITYSGTIK
jgi:DNA-directed RNA polymerase subunit H (RpoH/RPB5)